MQAKVPVFMTGSPGVGKSDAVRQIGAEQKREVIDLRMSLLNPVDLRGVPVAKDGVTSWLAPSFLPTGESDAIVFLDELNVAPPAVQAAAYQLVLDRQVGEYKLPEGCDIVAAGNTAKDRAIVYEMSSALRNRFCHLNIHEDLDEWKNWAFQHGIADGILGFLNFRQERLFFFDPKVHKQGFPTPRSWAFVSNVLQNVGSSYRSYGDVFAGMLGDGVGAELMSFLKIAASIPDAEAVIIRGDMSVKAPSKNDAGILHAFAGALTGTAVRAKDPIKAGQNLSKYLVAGKMPKEFTILAAKDFARSPVFAKVYRQLLATKEWQQFCEATGETIMH